MSLQALLPKDCLVRALAICRTEEKLPVKYQSKDGPAKKRNSDTLTTGNVKHFITPYLVSLDSVIKSSKTDGTIFDCNLSAWKSIQILISESIMNESYYHNDTLSKDIAASSNIVSTRVGNWLTNVDRQLLRSSYTDQEVIFHKFMSLAMHLESARDTYNSSVNSAIKKWKRNGSNDDYNVPDPFSSMKPIKVYQVGGIIILSITLKHREAKAFVFTNTHFSRVVDYLKTSAIFAMYSPDINGFDPSMSNILRLLRRQAQLGVISPNGVGGIYKTARQILFLDGDKSAIMGVKAVRLFSAGLSGVKAKYGDAVAEELSDMTMDRKSALNLANIFRIVPHPDAHMDDVFNSVEGFKNANEVDDKVMPRYEGNVNKSMYESLIAQKFDIRVEAIGEGDPVIDSFVRKVNSTSTPISSILSHGYFYWSSIKFVLARGLFDNENQDIPVSNKSSGPSAKLTDEEEELIKNPKSLNQYIAIKKKLKAVNDVVSVLSGKDDLDYKNARSRFQRVIAQHRRFEEEFLADGVKVDDIPSEDLEKFVRMNKDASYTVSTEPKLGEVHKEITRMFYMAEQALKVMTQVTERLMKKVISKSAGISIVKSNRARRKEMEEMLDAYTGITFTEDEDGTVSVIYTSFDMSEFSKKFPQKLVRTIGRALSNLTGEDWLSRIDIFFRAAIVYHNTRGFLGSKAGVTGGFEGFLNFLWTLAMKVVMDIASEATGVEGVLAVYSDDGLLRLYVDGSKEKIQEKIMTIKKVFKDHGLIFHLDKTVVSAEILEYLGMYAENGMLIPTWMKEVMSIGKRKRSTGLDTVYDKVQLWDSQTSAVIKSQGPQYPSLLVKNILTLMTLRRLNNRVSSRHLSLLTMIPSSAGGFRTSSLSEMCLQSSIEGFSEFAADIELLSMEDRSASNAIAITIYENLKKEKEAERSIPTGSFLQTTLPDTSGLGTAMKLIEETSVNHSLAKDPVTSEVRDLILGGVRSASNVSQRTIREMVSEVPSVIIYNKTVAIMRSSAALEFVTSKDIRRAQMNDTKKCKRSITYWVDKISTFTGRNNEFSASSFCSAISNKLYPSYKFASFKQSPRICLVPCDEDADIISAVEFTEDDRITMQSYIEPKYKHLGAQLTPEITAETTFNTTQRMIERFVSTAARLVSTNISLLGVYYIVANAFSLPCPTVSTATVLSSHRSTKNFGYGAVSATLTVPYHALCSSRMAPNMYKRLRGKSRADRTTLVEAARISSSIRSSIRDKTKYRVEKGTKSYLYSVTEIDLNTSNPTMDTIIGPDKLLIDGKTTKAFVSVLIEENAQAKSMESIISTKGLIECIDDDAIVKGILISKMSKWLLTTIRGSHSYKCIPYSIPDPWKKEIYIESIISVGFTNSDPNVRRAIQLNFAELIDETRYSTTEELLSDPEYLRRFSECYSYRASSYEHLDSHIRKIGSSLSLLDIDTKYQTMLSTVSLDDSYVRSKLLDFLKRRSVSGGVSLPTIVINTDSFADTRMSRLVKNSIKDLVDSSVCSYLDRATKNRDIDESPYLDSTINYLILLKGMLRPSGHRNTPFNKHMMMIQLVKYELFLQDSLRLGIDKITTEDLSRYRLPSIIARRIISTNIVIRGECGLTSGSDMRDCLLREGILGGMVSRTNYILKTHSLSSLTPYAGNSINEESIMEDRLFCHKLLTYVLDTYNNTVKTAVDRLEIRHNRESEMITSLTTLSPVDEVGLIMANTVTESLVGKESNVSHLLCNETYCDLLTNLLLAHMSRWCIDGYNAGGNMDVNAILRRHGILGEHSLDVRNGRGHSLMECTTIGDYSLHFSSYETDEQAIHNYLYVNRLAGGMAVMAKSEDSYLLLSILPSGTIVVNTDSLSVPEYFGAYTDKPVIYNVETASSRIGEIARSLGIRPRLRYEREEMSTILIRQAYQRIVGATDTIEDEDHFLVAMAELARGCWSEDIGLRIYAMFVSWYLGEGEITSARYKQIAGEIGDRYGTNYERVVIHTNANAVWEWLRLMRISGGSNIDSSRVSKIARAVAKNRLEGGIPTSLLNMIPIDIKGLKLSRSNQDMNDILFSTAGVLFLIPPRVEREIEVDPDFQYDTDSSSDSSFDPDEW